MPFPSIEKREVMLSPDSLDDVRTLVRALVLGEGFSFHLIVASSPRSAKAAFELLERDEELVRRGLVFERFRPDLTIAPGLALPAASTPRESAVVIDLSYVVSEESAAFESLCEQLNATRNAWAQSLVGPLIVCVPDFAEGLFGRTAPDLWSIRSSVSRMVERPSLVSTERARRWLAEWLSSSRTLEELEAYEQGASGEVSAEDVEARRELAFDAIFLSMTAQTPMTGSVIKREDLSEALERANASLDQARKHHRMHPSAVMARIRLATALGQVASVEQALGDLSASRERLVEADELFASLSPVGMPVHELMLRKLGEVERARGDLDRARDAFARHVELVDQLAREDGAGLTAQTRAASARVSLGAVDLERGATDDARRGLEEAVTMYREIERISGPVQGHAFALKSLASVHSNSPTTALRIIDEAISVAASEPGMDDDFLLLLRGHRASVLLDLERLDEAADGSGELVEVDTLLADLKTDNS